jgi:hypothetical protein
MTHGWRNPTLLNSLKEILTVFHWNNLYLIFKGLFREKLLTFLKLLIDIFLLFLNLTYVG